MIQTKPPPHLSEAQLGVQVLVNLLDHVLQTKVSLRSSQLLHHELQLLQVNVVVFLDVVPSTNQREDGSFMAQRQQFTTQLYPMLLQRSNTVFDINGDALRCLNQISHTLYMLLINPP